MSRIYWVFLPLYFLLSINLTAQKQKLEGAVFDESGEPLMGAAVQEIISSVGTVTDASGYFSIFLPDTLTHFHLKVSYLGYQTLDTISQTIYGLLILKLKPSDLLLEELEIRDSKTDDEIVNVHKIDAEAATNLTSVFGDFSRVIASMPGVTSNNEMSSGYAVRGGNFDENLVYVNEIPIYRPFLSNAGQQEGLSFVNPELVSNINFYSGGWQPRHGDKMSSNLVISYKEPVDTEARATIGLMGGSAYLGKSSANKRINYLVGIRHRDSRYLLNSLEVSGQYFPKYTDIQSLITFDLTRKSKPEIGKTKLNWLMSYSRNRYLTLPVSQTTEFGSIQATFRLQTAFQGRELLNYDTYQTGFNLLHRYNQRIKTNLIGSYVTTRELENYEVEGAYRLCDVDNNPASGTFDNCVVVRGVGTDYRFGRNQLNADIATLENRHEFNWSAQHKSEVGVGLVHQNIADQLNEYRFRDSAGFVNVTDQVLNNLSLSNQQYFAYFQQQIQSRDSAHHLIAGGRFHYYTLNQQMLFSPRLLYSHMPRWSDGTRINASVGLYQQPPFYRELRDISGIINPNIRAQSSWHFVLGFDRNFIWSGRPFTLSTSLYYKYLYNITPFEIDNVRLRYYASNLATGFATGLDIRVNGEFIPGTQSWFSLGLLKTKERIPDDGRGFIRRPLDQVVTISAYFEDHMPNDPTLRVYLTLNLGSGYPFGPPGNPALRNVFSGDEYYRADIGLSKLILAKRENFNQYWIRLEVLNALGADNTLSYTWINDVNGNGFAIPNSLSARLINLKFSVDF